MTTAAFKGGLVVKHTTNAIEEVISLGGFGVTNPLIDVTSHDSTAREYIAGLADGAELTIECNRVHTALNIQDDVIDDVDAGNTVSFIITLTDGTTLITYTFNAVCLAWVINPPFEDKATITFTIKISGSIVVT